LTSSSKRIPQRDLSQEEVLKEVRIQTLKVVGTVLAILVGIFIWGNWGFAPYHQPPQEEQNQAKDVLIRVGSFFFEGPVGHSSSKDDPQVVARLKNGEKVKLIFENVASIPHEVVSPLFSAPEEKVFTIQPGERLEIELTPRFLMVEDGETLTFDLSCHVGHGTGNDHFLFGMRALIEIVPD